MKQIQSIIIAFLLIGYSINTLAQNTVWGEYKIKLLEEKKKMKVTFSYSNDIFYLVPGKEKGSVILGNDNYKVIYNSKDDKGYLVEVLAGKEYMSDFQINNQKRGFPYSEGMEGLNIVMEKFAKLSDKAYHPPKDFTPGWTDAKETHINYMELLGEGKAYYGSHNKEGEMDGKGTYILKGPQAFTGHFDKNVSNGEFIIQTKGDYDFKGEMKNNQQVGTWIKRKKTYPNEGFLYEVRFENNQIKSTKEISQKQDKSIQTAMEKGHLYKSYLTEVKKDGKWKTDFSLRDSLEYFEIEDRAKMLTNVKYMKVDDKKTAIAENKSRQMYLTRVEEDNEKRIEYYSYSFKEDFGHTSPTITFYKNRKEVPNSFMKEYNILFYFPHEKGEYRYYFLLDDQLRAEIEKSKERDKLIKDMLNQVNEILDKEGKRKQGNK